MRAARRDSYGTGPRASRSTIARPLNDDVESAISLGMSAPVRRRPRAVVVTLAVGLPLSAVFLWLSLRDSDLDAVWGTISSARPVPLIGSVALVGLMYTLQSLRWRRIAHSGVPRRLVLGMLISSLAVNNVVPGRVGDLLRARWISQAGGLSGGRSLATVVLDRGGDLLVLSALLVLSLRFVTAEPWVDRVVFGGVAVVVLFLGGLVAARAYALRRPRIRDDDRRLLRRFSRDMLDGLSEPIRTRDAGVVLALSVGAWLAWAGAATCCGTSIGIDLSLSEALVLAGVVNLGVAIPSSPGFVGTYQWLVISTLSLFAIGRDDGLAFAILFQATWYVPTTLIGGLLLVTHFPGRIRITASPAQTAEQPAGARA